MIPKILSIWTRIEGVLIGLCITAALLVFLGGAAVRAFAPAYSVDWAEEVALYGIIWATVLAGSSLVAEGRHLQTEVFLTRFSLRTRTVIGWIMTGVATAFCAAMLVYGWQDILATDWAGLRPLVWITLVYVAICASAMTFVLLQYATLRLPSAKVMAYTYLTPSWVIVWEIALGHGAPGALVLGGVALTIVALVLLLRDEEAGRSSALTGVLARKADKA